MKVNFKQPIVLFLILTVICGVIYPVISIAIAKLAFPYQANGEISSYGSKLIGQRFKLPYWFQGRLDQDNPLQTGGTNLGPHSKALLKQVLNEKNILLKEKVKPTEDLVTGSGSGVDPDITVSDALSEVNVIASARHLKPSVLISLVKSHVIGRQFGFLGQRYVNVLELNIALNNLIKKHK